MSATNGSDVVSSASVLDEDSIFVFLNSKSGGQMGPTLMKAFGETLPEGRVFDLSRVRPADKLQEIAAMPGNKRIVVCGGDGTMGWLLSAIDSVEATPGSLPIAMMPLGTGNDLARSFKWGPGYTKSMTKPAWLKKVAKAQPVKFDRWMLCVIPFEPLPLRCAHRDQIPPIFTQRRYYDESAEDDGTDSPPSPLSAAHRTLSTNLLCRGTGPTSASFDERAIFVSRSILEQSIGEPGSEFGASFSPSYFTGSYVRSEGTGEQLAKRRGSGHPARHSRSVSEPSRSSISKNLKTRLVGSEARSEASTVEATGEPREEGEEGEEEGEEGEGRETGGLKRMRTPPTPAGPPPTRHTSVADEGEGGVKTEEEEEEEGKDKRRVTIEDGAAGGEEDESSKVSQLSEDLAKERGSFQPEGEWESYDGVFCNYFSFGVDALVTNAFHIRRNANPEKFKSRLGNMIWYGRLAPVAGGMVPCCCKPPPLLTTERLEVTIRRTPESEMETLELPQNLRSIIIVNLQSYSAGADVWGSRTYKGFKKAAYDDGLLELVGFRSINQLGRVKALNGVGVHGKRLAQAAEIRVKIHEEITMQLDGEPWVQKPGIVHISRLGQSTVLQGH